MPEDDDLKETYINPKDMRVLNYRKKILNKLLRRTKAEM
jgi:hypothetical protein